MLISPPASASSPATTGNAPATVEGVASPSRYRRALAASLAFLAFAATAAAAPVVTTNPILFVTRVPVGGFGSSTAVFGNQGADMEEAPRGGDLVLRLGDGTLRFLTAEAGYGTDGMQGANAIAVREPCVHWSGTKALFSMVVGAPTQQYQVGTYRWQIYEVTGFDPGQVASIRKIAGQPAEFDNVSPIYATDGRILFTSDRPPSGALHHFPPLDEYESAPTVAGIYSLDEPIGTLTLLEHAPSGATTLSLDSFGRVIFTKWDHLQRDQQGDEPDTAAAYDAFTWASEAADAPTTTSLDGAEVFPEPRSTNDPSYDPKLSRHPFNHFFPWELNEDGTAEETLNHVGRHELGGTYSDGSFVGDDNLSYYTPQEFHANQLYIGGDGGLFHLREDPTHPGDFLATRAPEFGTASGGTLMRLTGAPTLNADQMVLTAVTPTSHDADVPADTGYFRNPLPLADGGLVAVHTPATDQLTNAGSTAAPAWTYAYRLQTLAPTGAFWAPSAALTDGIVRNVSWWTPDVLATYAGPLWELDPVEVVARPIPSPRKSVVPDVEQAVFAAAGIDVDAFRAWLRDANLALVVGRNVTQRDRGDRHQPYNLRVPGGVESIGAEGAVYDVAFLQFFQADALRGYGDPATTTRGRRPLARPMHEPGVSQAAGAPSGAVTIGADGSMAALVPARRALSWQLTGPDGAGVVRERNWVSFQSGEIRVCASCHGINTESQTGDPPPTNSPAALAELLAGWKSGPGVGVGPGGCSGDVVVSNARLRMRRKVLFRGSMTLPDAPTPTSAAFRVRIGTLLDATLPGSGWSSRAKGRRWIFVDRSGANGGVVRVDLVSAPGDPTRVTFRIVATTAAAKATPQAIVARVSLGSAACATASWNGPDGAPPRCTGRAGKMACR